MHRTSPKIPAIVTLLAACFICIAVVFINISAQAPAGDPMAVSQSLFSWFVAAAGFLMMATAVVYGFLKKQKYENLKTERDELKSLSESRGERIKELHYTHSEAKAQWDLKLSDKDADIRDLRVSNRALVTMSLQMKAILKGLRLAGVWHGHEDDFHETDDQ